MTEIGEEAEVKFGRLYADHKAFGPQEMRYKCPEGYTPLPTKDCPGYGGLGAFACGGMQDTAHFAAGWSNPEPSAACKEWAHDSTWGALTEGKTLAQVCLSNGLSVVPHIQFTAPQPPIS